MERLAESASGLRHLRWGREILAALEVHYEHDPRLSQGEREHVLTELMEVRVRITVLSNKVKAYRDFKERERTRFRGMVRVGRHLVSSAQSAEERSEAEAILGGFEEAFAAMEQREREPRQLDVRIAVKALREWLEEMDERLSRWARPGFVDSLYPPLAAGGTMIADVEDGDDDATAAP
jgi:hypothetical protein